jgi:hypothetical protein
VTAPDGQLIAAAELPCQVCGRRPTTLIAVSRNLGLIVLRRYWTYQAPLCREHGTQLAANWLLATLLMGWWGVISFFMNFGAVAKDVGALRAARRLALPGSAILPAGFGAGSAPVPASPLVPRGQLALAGAAILLIGGALVYEANFGPKPVGNLAVGDCFDEPSTAGVITQVPHRPCDQAHTAEVFAIVTYPDGQSGTYPSDAEFLSAASAQCGPAFDTYTAGGGGLAATVDLLFMTPTTEGWSSGDRTLVCYLRAPAGQTLRQSLRSATQ